MCSCFHFFPIGIYMCICIVMLTTWKKLRALSIDIERKLTPLIRPTKMSNKMMVITLIREHPINMIIISNLDLIRMIRMINNKYKNNRLKSDTIDCMIVYYWVYSIKISLVIIYDHKENIGSSKSYSIDILLLSSSTSRSDIISLYPLDVLSASSNVKLSGLIHSLVIYIRPALI